jgi:hypothetical protein
MKAKKNHLILKAYLEQKETLRIKGKDGQYVELYMGRKYNENGRESHPNVCEVVAVGEGITDINVEDKIVVHHNTITNDGAHIEKKDGYVYLSAPYNRLIYAKINEDGSLSPLSDCIIAERIAAPKLSQFDYTEKTEQYKFKVVTVPDGYEDVRPGQNVLCYKLSDYEIVYHYNNVEKRAIRIMQDDILAVFAD